MIRQARIYCVVCSKHKRARDNCVVFVVFAAKHARKGRRRGGFYKKKRWSDQSSTESVSVPSQSTRHRSNEYDSVWFRNFQPSKDMIDNVQLNITVRKHRLSYFMCASETDGRWKDHQ